MTWSLSNRNSFTYFPAPDQTTLAFLSRDGATKDEIRAAIPYQAERAGAAIGGVADEKRYRDPRMVLEQLGILYREDDQGTERIRLTPLGKALAAWRGTLNAHSIRALVLHVALALRTCQLPNPTRFGSAYDPAQLCLFPFAIIWEAMLRLDGKISSDELLCELFRVTKHEEIDDCVQRIQNHRTDPARFPLRAPISADPARNDRAISWMALASCGWLLIKNKRETESDYYEIRDGCVPALRAALAVPARPKQFEGPTDYIKHIGEAAMLPPRI